MIDRIKRFITKKGISAKNILYILRDNGKTAINTTDGRIIATYFSMKNILSVLGSDDIFCINKGVAISKTKVVSIKNGIYTMSDGMSFAGRVRTPGEHKRNGAIVSSINAPIGDVSDLTPKNIVQRFSVLDTCPLPVGVFEIVYSDDDVPADMVFRYLNRQMAHLADSTVVDSRDKSFFHVFSSNDKGWLEINAEVSDSGEPRSVTRFSPEVGRDLSLYYFSPLPGYSACILV